MGNRTKFRGGSLPIFAVVGVVLAVVLIGGLYALQRYSSQIESAGETVASEAGELIAGDDTTNESTSKDKDAKSQESKPDMKQQKDKNDATVSSDSDAAPETETRAPAVSNDTTDAADDSEQSLPETGPADTALQLLAVSLITFAGVSYARSRQPL